MKLISALISLAISVGTLSGQPPESSRFVDEFSDELCSDDLRARFDTFFVEVARSAGLEGLVSISPGKDLPGRSLKIRRMLSNHINFRGQDPDRFRISLVQSSIASIKFWLVPKGITMPSIGVAEKVTYLPVTLFDSSGIFKSVVERGVFARCL